MQSAFDGYNVCMYAYGQTGSGKTFTITGSMKEPGIVPRAVEELFAITAANESKFEVSLQCWMMEVYRENLVDLLSMKREGVAPPKLELYEDTEGCVHVRNVVKTPVASLKEAMSIYSRGLQQRKSAFTEMSDHSSRSHLIFALSIETLNRETQMRT